MGFNDHFPGEGPETVTCPYCRREYLQTKYEQTPGCRDLDYDVCPYCGKTVRQSMEYEFRNHKKEEK